MRLTKGDSTQENRMSQLGEQDFKPLRCGTDYNLLMGPAKAGVAAATKNVRPQRLSVLTVTPLAK